MTPHDYCAQRTAQSHSSFSASFRFLPSAKRRAMTALYAFCREVDDVVDECSEPDIARIKLAWWRNELIAMEKNSGNHPVIKALQEARQAFQLPIAHLAEIIDGMEMDLDQNRYADFPALHLYCHRVASVVGLLIAEILGYTNSATLEYARELGLAFQLTNIIRDVGEDARLGRIYLPQEELAQFGVSESDILACHPTDNFHALMTFQAKRAHEYYELAIRHLPACDRRAQCVGLVMAAIYRKLLDEITDDGFRVLTHRVRLSKLQKIWLTTVTWLVA
ncbi:MAG: presqualene diphosphate synthase HpnD [Rhodocyclaceae bacterium]|nr:presqualene diphosphate synthase HpnD [Rhodocyclaceae bacterium]